MYPEKVGIDIRCIWPQGRRGGKGGGGGGVRTGG